MVAGAHGLPGSVYGMKEMTEVTGEVQSAKGDGASALRRDPFYAFHYVLIFFGVFVLLQDLIAENCRPLPRVYRCVKYSDEVFVILSFLLVAVYRLRKKIFPLKTGIEWPLLGFLLVGIISSIAAKVPTFIAASQLVLYAKGFLLFYVFANLPVTETVLRKYTRAFFWVAAVILALGVVDFAYPTWFRAATGNVARMERRAGILSVESVFVHPGAFAWFTAYMGLFVLAFFLVTGKWRYFLLSIAFSYGVVFSMRRKAIIGLLLAAGSACALKRCRSWKNVLCIAILGLCVVVPNYNRIYSLGSSAAETYGRDYLAHTGDVGPEDAPGFREARMALYFTSLKVAKDHLPLGAGFGRYGSWMSRVHYSPLYDTYELSSMPGLSRKN
ncbi:MAG: hypothetical protein QF662_03495, partial [Phycisphaerae bacterium]|nr:hypothetical protein [Phycisphaerae bacterium]